MFDKHIARCCCLAVAITFGALGGVRCEEENTLHDAATSYHNE